MSEGLRPQETQARRELNGKLKQTKYTNRLNQEDIGGPNRTEPRAQKNRTVRRDPEGLQADYKVDYLNNK